LNPAEITAAEKSLTGTHGLSVPFPFGAIVCSQSFKFPPLIGKHLRRQKLFCRSILQTQLRENLGLEPNNGPPYWSAVLKDSSSTTNNLFQSPSIVTLWISTPFSNSLFGLLQQRIHSRCGLQTIRSTSTGAFGIQLPSVAPRRVQRVPLASLFLSPLDQSIIGEQDNSRANKQPRARVWRISAFIGHAPGTEGVQRAH